MSYRQKLIYHVLVFTSTLLSFFFLDFLKLIFYMAEITIEYKYLVQFVAFYEN